MTTLLQAGFALGAAFGAASRLGQFCLLRGLRQALAHGRGGAPALQAFSLALAVALLASQAMAWAGAVDLDRAQVARAGFSWLGVLLGGALFGAGMVLARGCGARCLVLLAGGNLRALVALLFLALGAQAARTGVLAPLREALQGGLAALSLGHATLPGALRGVGLPDAAVRVLAVGLPVLALLGYALGRPGLRASALQTACAAAIGALVAAGWWVTAHVGVDPFEPAPLSSLSFIAPVADVLLYVQLAAGRPLTLGAALVGGTFTGAAVVALLTRSVRWEGFHDPGRLAASAAGGVLMGLGGVMAAGCSIGQGLAGLSTLAFASVPAVAGICAGALLALRLSTLLINPGGDLHP